jgi:predicted RND superfamily exporter protein
MSDDSSSWTVDERDPPARGYALFEWINDHITPLAIGVVLVAIVLAVITPAVADDGEPSFDPSGEIYDTAARVDEVFAASSPLRTATFLVETPSGGDVLTQASLLELLENEQALLADPDSQAHLATVFDQDLGIPVDGVYSIADAVDASLPGGLAGASDADVKAALSELLADEADTSGLRFLLSTTSTTRTPTTVDGETVVEWESPAFYTLVAYDIDTFEGSTADSFGDESNLDAERWLRDVQSLLRGDEDDVTAIGLFIDIGLVGEEQGAAAAPFIFGAIAFVLIIAGALLRSYWAGMLVGAGLGVVMMGYNGINALIGLKTGSPLLIMVVPISLISFGVDFFIHGSGRTREEQVDGVPRTRAYPLGETAVFAALLLAAASSVGAFLSNSVSGIQAIIQFGVAASIGLVLCYLVLGWLVPKLLLSVEGALGPRPIDLSHVRVAGQKVGFVAAAFIGGIAVTMAIVFPAAGWIAYVLFLALFLYLPFRLTRRRNQRAVEAGRPTSDEVRGAGHGFVAAGSLVHFLARWRIFTLPAVAVLAVLGLIGASRVDEGFEVKDFFSSDTDLVRGLEKNEEYYGEGGGDLDYVFLEGDLTGPDTLAAIEGTEQRLSAADAEFMRDFNGDVQFSPNAATVARIATSSAPMRDSVAAATGVQLTDTDGNGLPDSADQVAAIYRYVADNSVVGDDGVEVFTPAQTETFLAVDDDTQATTIGVVVATITDEDIILPARDALEDAGAALEEQLADEAVTVRVSGAAITGQDSLDAFTSAMLISLPVAIALTAVLVFIALFFVFRHFGRRTASILKRSTRYALISMVPILLVVAWVYGFMYLVGYEINVITATMNRAASRRCVVPARAPAGHWPSRR